MLSNELMTELMQEALRLAVYAQEADEVPIGALVYSEEEGIIGRGYNQTRTCNDPSAHAETIAIRQACGYLKNYRLPSCYIVSTIEPCFFCFGVILNARLRGVIYGAPEPKMGALTHAIIPTHMQRHLHYIHHGICMEECMALMQAFFKEKRAKN
ncbi:MAG: nucleoside deaminase [Desulfovibrionaceae bacterium]|nr:nucleoside deaminase [Desulfovibrionaceae bacterium]